MKFIKKLLMDKKLQKLRIAAFNYREHCEEWERKHYTEIINDCNMWIDGVHKFRWDEVMRLANQHWSDCNQS